MRSFERLILARWARRFNIMVLDDDKTCDNIKVPCFDHSNKTISHDTKIKTYTQSFKCSVMTKFGMKDSVLFSTARYHEGW